jgi:hypothetical protein
MTAYANIHSRSIRARNWQRVILLVSIALFLPIVAYAQDESQKDVPQTKKAYLKFKLILLTPTVCVGVPLKLRLEVSNVGQETVELNRAYFWELYSWYPVTPEGEDKGRGEIIVWIWPRSTSEDIISLAPGKTYIAHSYWSFDDEVRKAGRWSLADEGSKPEPGNYSLKVKTSNRVQFELHDCRQKELKEQ